MQRTVGRQAGVIALSQTVALGMSARTVQRRVRNGAWRELHPRVDLVGGHQCTDEARVRAAWLWAGGEPAAAGWDLLRFTWHDLNGRPAEVAAEIKATLVAAA
ncbi:hypothetical protein GCM10009609_30930 [Pseudonocardia aurantiaca]